MRISRIIRTLTAMLSVFTPPALAQGSQVTDSLVIDASTSQLYVVVDSIGSAPDGRHRAKASNSELTELSYYDIYANLPQPPTAAAISKSINIPVNYAYGLPEIKFPLYDMVVDDIRIPIYLEYRASGIKINEPYSPFGAGWSLHAEPSISRTVRGLPDEDGSLYSGITYPSGTEEKRNWIYKKMKDKMPDIFDYQLLDRSGSFNFDGTANGSVVTRPFDPIKVNYTYSGTYLSGFKINDENGLTYTFDDSNVCRTNTDTPSIDIISEWKCSSIKSTKSGRTVEFEYWQDINEYRTEDSYVVVEYFASDANANIPKSSDLYLYGLRGRFAVKEYDGSSTNMVKALRYYNKSNGQEVAESSLGFTYSEAISEQFTNHPGDITINNLLIGTIKAGTYTITFEYLPSGYGMPKTLHSMTVRNNGTVLRKITFYLSKMRSYMPQQEFFEHCKLDSFRIEDGGGRYAFEYNSPSGFPQRLSRSKDFWGYYNGSNNQTLVPRQQVILKDAVNNGSVYLTVGSANREPALVSMKVGSLSKIIYPTGGWTEFEYGTHNYSYPLEPPNYKDSYKGGGLRIESITDYDSDATLLIRRTFTYTGGKCRFPPIRYNYDIAHAAERFRRYGYRNSDYYYYRTSSTSQMANFHTKACYVPANALTEWPARYGSPVVYQSVTEDRSDGSRSVYYYKWGDDFDQTDEEYKEMADKKDGWLFGQPYLRRDYAKRGDYYDLVHSTGYTYDGSYNNAHNRQTVNGYDYWDNVRFYGDIDASSSATAFAVFPTIFDNKTMTGANKLLEERDSVFSDNTVSVTVKNYKYALNQNKTDPTALLKETKTTLPDGTWTAEGTVYPTDITLSGTIENARQALVNKWLVGSPIVRTVSRNGNSVAYARYDYSNTDVPRLSALQFGKTAATMTERMLYSNYTAYGKPMYIVTDGVRKTVLLYSYQGEHPVAVITGATFADVANALSGGTTFINALCAKPAPTASDFSTLNALKTGLPAALVTIYEYKSHVGISSIDAPGTSPVTFDYDAVGRLTDSWQGGYLLERNSYNYKYK